MSGPISTIAGDGEGFAPVMERGLAAGVVGGTVASATGGNFDKIARSDFDRAKRDPKGEAQDVRSKMV